MGSSARPLRPAHCRGLRFSSMLRSPLLTGFNIGSILSISVVIIYKDYIKNIKGDLVGPYTLGGTQGDEDSGEAVTFRRWFIHNVNFTLCPSCVGTRVL